MQHRSWLAPAWEGGCFLGSTRQNWVSDERDRIWRRCQSSIQAAGTENIIKSPRMSQVGRKAGRPSVGDASAVDPAPACRPDPHAATPRDPADSYVLMVALLLLRPRGPRQLASTPWSNAPACLCVGPSGFYLKRAEASIRPRLGYRH